MSPDITSASCEHCTATDHSTHDCPWRTDVLLAPAEVPTTARRGRAPSIPSTGADAIPRNEVSRILRTGRVVLTVVAFAGAALSFASLYAAAAARFPRPRVPADVPLLGGVHVAGVLVPIAVDALILGASLQFLAAARMGRGNPGWRVLAHAGVAGTVWLNALAAPTLAAVPWHVVGPLVWSALVELTARDLIGDYRASHTHTSDRLPLRLWLTAPGESLSTWLRLARQRAHADARVDVGTHAAAIEALRLALPGRRARRVRRVLRRQLRAGSLSPDLLIARSLDLMADLPSGTPRAVLRDVLAHLIRGQAPAETSGRARDDASPPDGTRHAEDPDTSVDSPQRRHARLVAATAGRVLPIDPDATPGPLSIDEIVERLVREVESLRVQIADLDDLDAEDADASPRPAANPPRPAPRATGSATATGVRVRRLRAQHPDWTTAQIAKRAGVHPRTVRRHLTPDSTTDDDVTAA